jgi:hypothetical protein
MGEIGVTSLGSVSEYLLIQVDHTMYTYLRSEIQCILTTICCVSGCNYIYQIYIELQCRFSKIESCGGITQIRRNCNGIYPINPF